MSKTQLQEMLNEFGCSVLNYSDKKIYVDHFYNQERYRDYLNGINCRQGVGLFDEDEELIFNRLNDNTLVVVQKDGVEVGRHRYTLLFKATMEYQQRILEDKKVNKTLTFRIRKHEFNGTLNLIDTDGNSQDFASTNDAKKYLNKQFGTYKLTDWSVFLG